MTHPALALSALLALSPAHASPELLAPVAEEVAEPAATLLPVHFEADQTVTIDAPVDDLFAFAQDVQIQALVQDNAFTLAQRIRLEPGEEVAGDLYAMSETTEIRGRVRGDLYAMSGAVLLAEEAQVDGHVFVGAGQVKLEGAVGGNIEGGGGEILLDGPVGGDVRLDAGSLALGSDAALAGDLTYTSAHEASIDERASVAGRTTFELVEEDDLELTIEEEPSLLGRMFGETLWLGWTYLGALSVGFAGLFLMGPAASRPARALLARPGPALGLGFVVACVLPVASMMAIATIVPLPLGVIGLVAWAVGMYLAKIVAGQALGDAMLTRIQPGSVGSPYVSLAVGLLVLSVAMALPYVGTLVWIAAVVAGLGGMWAAFRGAPDA